ncbi:MAG: zinc ribbon domain-containing protein [Chloroflexi bacterium]|nr:zinc ribbon domain-containing protein [Chloroflexota bacterium]
MPLYAYRCNDCGHEFEQRQKFSDDALTVCPTCEGHIRRVVNSVGIVFKGSGFYVTDNRGKSSSKSKSSGKEKSEAATNEKKAETKSEKKEKPKKEAAK